MRQNNYHICAPILLTIIMLLCASCQQKPQPVRNLSEKQEVDSTLMAQLQLNTHLAELADKECHIAIKADSTHQYTIDDYGFWYTKTISTKEDEIQEEQEITLNIKIYYLDEQLISDSQITTHIAASRFPIAITRSIKKMRLGEQMRIISPWYAAYGVEGTSIIKPYSNLLIILTIEQ